MVEYQRRGRTTQEPPDGDAICLAYHVANADQIYLHESVHTGLQLGKSERAGEGRAMYWSAAHVGLSARRPQNGDGPFT